MIDAKRYPLAKEEGLATIIEKDGEHFISFKRFDVRNGSETDPELQCINMEEILERKRILELELAGINQVCSDLDKIKNPAI